MSIRGIEKKLRGIKLHNTLQSPQINSVRMRNRHFWSPPSRVSVTLAPHPCSVPRNLWSRREISLRKKFAEKRRCLNGREKTEERKRERENGRKKTGERTARLETKRRPLGVISGSGDKRNAETRRGRAVGRG